MRKSVAFIGLLFFSCLYSKEERHLSEVNPQVIAYYAGDEKSIDEFNLEGVDQLIYSFLHLKENQLTIDNEVDSLTLLNVVNQKKKSKY